MHKILYITSRSDYGGGPEHIHQLIKRLSSRFRIFIASPKDEPYYARFKDHGECIEIPHRRFSRTHLICLVRLIKQEGIDLIHSHGKGAGVYSRMLGVICRKPVVHTFHGFHYSQLRPVSRLLNLGAEKLLGRFTDLYIAVSESERDACAKTGLFDMNKVVVIPNGVEVPLFKQKKPTNRFRIITVARLSPIKGVDIIVDIARELGSIADGYEILIVGDGPERPSLEKKAQGLENIRFLGFRTDVPELLDSSDVFLSASRGEGMPLSLLEAMARALPVVASDVMGNRDLVGNGTTGFLFDIKRPAEAAEKIALLIKDRRLYGRLSKNAYEAASSEHSVEKMCDKTALAYKAVLDAVQRRSGKRKALRERPA
ncbi:MAG: glycosyltransferase family 4 protein [Deltaproteobacteria bacterium]